MFSSGFIYICVSTEEREPKHFPFLSALWGLCHSGSSIVGVGKGGEGAAGFLLSGGGVSYEGGIIHSRTRSTDNSLDLLHDCNL